MTQRNSKISRRRFLKRSGQGLLLAAAASAFGPLAVSCSGGGSEFDLVIRGGQVFDGSPADPQVADVAIHKGRIVRVGAVTGSAARVIEAHGLAVLPGLVDVHTHSDLTFIKSGAKRHLARFMPSWKGNHNILSQGVTTVVTGNCGLGYADTAPWLTMVDDLGFGTHVAHLAPHGSIREALFGLDQPGRPSPKQLDALKGRVADEMDKGALGFSAGLEYAPGLMAETDELIELARVVRKKGGLFTVHLRDESGAPNRGRPGLLKAIGEAIDIGRRAEIPVQISHLKIAAPYGSTTSGQVIDLIEKARAEGLDVMADQYPYDAGSTFATYLLPEEFKDPSGGVRPEYRTGEGKKKIEEAIAQVFSYLGPEKTMITMNPGREELEGKNIQEIAGLLSMTPAQAYAELVSADDPPTAVFFCQDMAIVKELCRPDWVLTASDGWTVPKGMTRPHPRTYGCFPRKLRRFALDEPLVKLNQAVRSMTSLPAQRFGLKDRGRIAEGMAADVVMMDWTRLKDLATYQDPHQYSEGVVHVIVNGVLALENGRPTGDRGGRGLRKA